MALLGVQLVITMIMASFLQKLSPHFSLARWLLCSRLVRYLHPSSEELRHLAGPTHFNSNNKGKNKSNRDRRINGQSKKDETFKVPRNINIQLESARIQPIDVVNLHFYAEYHWLIDFSACCIVVYALTELYFYLLPNREEYNLSIVWCLIVIVLCLKVLFSVTALYFKGDESSGERSMCVTSGSFFFVAAMVVLIVDEEILEFGLDKAYLSFNESVGNFLESQGVKSKQSASLMGFKFTLAFWCGLVGAFFTFPGLRFAKMHYDSLKYCTDSMLWKVIFNLSFVSPFLLILLWVKPIAKDYFTSRSWLGGTTTIMTPETFDISRLIMIILVVLLRLFLMPSYLQSYLNLAHERITEMKKEAGQITNVEIQKKVSRVFYYLCVVALQYVAPLLLCCFFTFLLKTLGNYSWLSYFSDTCMDPSLMSSVKPTSAAPVEAAATEDSSILATSQHFLATFGNARKIFTPIVYRGVLNFMTWWLCSVWFATSTVGMVYHSYFAAQ